MINSALAILTLWAAASPAQPADTTRLDVRPSSRVWIDGGSNLRDWSCRATTFDARVDVDTALAARDGGTIQADMIRRVGVTVVVRDLKCGNRRMEKDLYHALKADETPTSSISAIFNAIPSDARPGSVIETEGTITVAGVERRMRVGIAIERLADGTVKATGSVPLLMTDFGVTPPTGLLGLVRSHNEVVVKFELVIARP